jgi:uncharacterized membrane protein (UPF0127 family)
MNHVIRSSLRFAGSLAMLCWGLAGCTSSTGSLPTVNVQIGQKTFELEVAADHASQEMGLMRRDSMPADHGMLFVFPDEQVLGFWMKDTRFPIDILFLSGARKVVSIRQMQPYDLDTISSGEAAKYAIELNKGVATAAQVHVGDEIQLPSSVLEPKTK